VVLKHKQWLISDYSLTPFQLRELYSDEGDVQCFATLSLSLMADLMVFQHVIVTEENH
jgi:hypothetical protein